MTPGIPGKLKNFRHVSYCSRFNKMPGLVSHVDVLDLSMTFIWLHRHKWAGVRSGDRGGHKTNPIGPIRLSLLLTSIIRYTSLVKLAGTLYASTTQSDALFPYFRENFRIFFRSLSFSLSYVTDNYPLYTRDSFLKCMRVVPKVMSNFFCMRNGNSRRRRVRW